MKSRHIISVMMLGVLILLLAYMTNVGGVKKAVLINQANNKPISAMDQALIKDYENKSAPKIATGAYQNTMTKGLSRLNLAYGKDTIFIDNENAKFKETMAIETYWLFFIKNKFSINVSADLNQQGSTLKLSNVKGDLVNPQSYPYEVIDKDSFYLISYCEPQASDDQIFYRDGKCFRTFTRQPI